MPESAWLFAPSQMVPKRSRKRYLYICIQSLENGPSREKDQPTWVLWGWAQSRSAQASLASSPVHVLLATWHHHSRARGWWVWRKRKAAKGVLERFVARFLWECIPVQQKGALREILRADQRIHPEMRLHRSPVDNSRPPSSTTYGGNHARYHWIWARTPRPSSGGLEHCLSIGSTRCLVLLGNLWNTASNKRNFRCCAGPRSWFTHPIPRGGLVTATISGQKQPRSAMPWLNKWIISSKALGRLLRCALPSFQLQQT